LSVQKEQKGKKFSVERLYVDDRLERGCYIKRVARGDKLYIYIYEGGDLLMSLKVTVRE